MGVVTTPGQNERTTPGNVYKASGNFGHEGRPGEVGGSAPSGGGGGETAGKWKAGEGLTATGHATGHIEVKVTGNVEGSGKK